MKCDIKEGDFFNVFYGYLYIRKMEINSKRLTL